jgi:hypothetical protein
MEQRSNLFYFQQRVLQSFQFLFYSCQSGCSWANAIRTAQSSGLPYRPYRIVARAAVTIQNRIREILGSNLGRNLCYTDWSYLLLPLTLQTNAMAVSLLR